jgi:hypothetical protein
MACRRAGRLEPNIPKSPQAAEKPYRFAGLQLVAAGGGF